MNKYMQSSLAGIVLVTAVGCSLSSEDYADTMSISCDDPENPTATIRIKTLNMIDVLCSYSRVEVVPGDIYYNTVKHCLTMLDKSSPREDGILTKSLTQTGQKINSNITTINAIGSMPKTLPISQYTNEQMNNKSVTIFVSNPNSGSKTKSCYKITGPYASSDGYGFVVIRSDDFQEIEKLAKKDNVFGGSSGSAVLDHEGKIFGRLSASTNSNLSILGTVLLIHPIRKPDGSILVDKK